MFVKDLQINMPRASDKEKNASSTEIEIHDLQDIGRILYPLSYKNSWRAKAIQRVLIHETHSRDPPNDDNNVRPYGRVLKITSEGLP